MCFRDDVLWNPWVADLVERIDQGILVVRLECNMEVNINGFKKAERFLVGASP